MEKYNITGVEIFSCGTWNGDEYTVLDLNKIAEAFSQTKEGVRPHLKLGHNEDQKLLQADGLPAAGWIDRVYVKGEKLVADFVDIPKKIFELIQAGAYKKVSCEIFNNISIKDTKYQYLLSAVALLGADTPGVMNLSDILAMYKQDGKNPPKFYFEQALEFKFNEGENEPPRKDSKMPKTENEIKLEFDLKAKSDEATAAQAKADAAQAELDAQKKENEELKKFKIEAEKKQAELALEAEQARISKFVTELQAEKLCTPAMKDLVIELLGPEKKEYSIKTKEKEEKLSKEQLFKETLKLFKAASEVNFEESSEDGEKDSKVDEAAQDKKIREYAAEHKVTYGQAMKAILKEQK